jgi:hypothetical protein
MTAILVSRTEWGVRHRTSPTGVDERTDEPDARWWQGVLSRCGNTDAELVARAARDAAWIPMGGAT